MLLASVDLSLLLCNKGQEILEGLSDHALYIDPLSGTSSDSALELVEKLFCLRVPLGCESSYVPILRSFTRIAHRLVLLRYIVLVTGVVHVLLLHYLLLLHSV